MAKVVLYMWMSLDGFIAGPADSVERLHQGLGDGGGETESYRPADDVDAQVFDELMETGAVIVGRRTFDLAEGWGGDHHDEVPIFIPTHREPLYPASEVVHYVTDGIESCVAQAKAAAGERNILLHGASTAQQCLRAGLLDEMEICLVPVLLGEGIRLFEDGLPESVELQQVRVLQSSTGTHLRYRVMR